MNAEKQSDSMEGIRSDQSVTHTGMLPKSLRASNKTYLNVRLACSVNP